MRRQFCHQCQFSLLFWSVGLVFKKPPNTNKHQNGMNLTQRVDRTSIWTLTNPVVLVLIFADAEISCIDGRTCRRCLNWPSTSWHLSSNVNSVSLHCFLQPSVTFKLVVHLQLTRFPALFLAFISFYYLLCWGINSSDLQWLVGGYSLGYGSTLLLTGRLSDLVSHFTLFARLPDESLNQILDYGSILDYLYHPSMAISFSFRLGWYSLEPVHSPVRFLTISFNSPPSERSRAWHPLRWHPPY